MLLCNELLLFVNQAKERFSLLIRPDGSANGYVSLPVTHKLGRGKQHSVAFFSLEKHKQHLKEPHDLVANYMKLFEMVLFL